MVGYLFANALARARFVLQGKEMRGRVPRRGTGRYRMRIAYQGDRGCNSEAAARLLFGDGPAFVPRRTLRDAFDALGAPAAADAPGTAGPPAAADAAVVPVENSTAGSIVDTYDLLWERCVRITGEVYLPVRHALMALPGVPLERLRRVVSHPQALAQCRRFLERLGLEPVPEWDTAGSARLVAERGWTDTGALAPPSAASIHGLSILAEAAEDVRRNTTRFLVIVPDGDVERPGAWEARARGERWTRGRPAAVEGPLAGGGRPALLAPPALGGPFAGDKCTLAFVTRHEPGALYAALGEFARRDLNLTKIESRPDPDRPWHFRFFVDVAAGLDDERMREALAGLRERCEIVRVLGAYRADVASGGEAGVAGAGVDVAGPGSGAVGAGSDAGA